MLTPAAAAVDTAATALRSLHLPNYAFSSSSIQHHRVASANVGALQPEWKLSIETVLNQAGDSDNPIVQEAQVEAAKTVNVMFTLGGSEAHLLPTHWPSLLPCLLRAIIGGLRLCGGTDSSNLQQVQYFLLWCASTVHTCFQQQPYSSSALVVDQLCRDCVTSLVDYVQRDDAVLELQNEFVRILSFMMTTNASDGAAALDCFPALYAGLVQRVQHVRIRLFDSKQHVAATPRDNNATAVVFNTCKAEYDLQTSVLVCLRILARDPRNAANMFNTREDALMTTTLRLLSELVHKVSSPMSHHHGGGSGFEDELLLAALGLAHEVIEAAFRVQDAAASEVLHPLFLALVSRLASSSNDVASMVVLAMPLYRFPSLCQRQVVLQHPQLLLGLASQVQSAAQPILDNMLHWLCALATAGADTAWESAELVAPALVLSLSSRTTAATTTTTDQVTWDLFLCLAQQQQLRQRSLDVVQRAPTSPLIDVGVVRLALRALECSGSSNVQAPPAVVVAALKTLVSLTVHTPTSRRLVRENAKLVPQLIKLVVTTTTSATHSSSNNTELAAVYAMMVLGNLTFNADTAREVLMLPDDASSGGGGGVVVFAATNLNRVWPHPTALSAAPLALPAILLQNLARSPANAKLMYDSHPTLLSSQLLFELGNRPEAAAALLGVLSNLARNVDVAAAILNDAKLADGLLTELEMRLMSDSEAEAAAAAKALYHLSCATAAVTARTLARRKNLVAAIRAREGDATVVGLYCVLAHSNLFGVESFRKGGGGGGRTAVLSIAVKLFYKAAAVSDGKKRGGGGGGWSLSQSLQAVWCLCAAAENRREVYASHGGDQFLATVVAVLHRALDKDNNGGADDKDDDSALHSQEEARSALHVVCLFASDGGENDTSSPPLRWLRANLPQFETLAETHKTNENGAMLYRLVQLLRPAVATVIAASPSSSSRPPPLHHVFVSYQSQYLARAKEITGVLRELGYQVWIDEDQMSGDILDSMASAVEQSGTVVALLSRSYRQSGYCGMEARFAYHNRRKIIPVVVEEGYGPFLATDGWLGLLMGTGLYYDVSQCTTRASTMAKVKEFMDKEEATPRRTRRKSLFSTSSSSVSTLTGAMNLAKSKSKT